MVVPDSVIQEYLDSNFQSLLVQVWFHGLYTILVVAAMAGFFFKRKDQNNRRLLGSVTVGMYLLSTSILAILWDWRRRSFVFNSANEHTIEFALGSIPFNREVPMAIAFSANIIIADCLFIWRSWIIWGQNWLIIIPSGMLTIANAVFSIISNYAQLSNSLTHGLKSTQSGSRFANSTTVYLSLSFSTTFLVTLLTCGRILWIHRQTKSALGNNYKIHVSNMKRGSSFSIIETIVESAALYAAAELIFLILLVRNNNDFIYAQGIVSQVTGMAPTLMLARIALGHTRPPTEWIPSRPEASPVRKETTSAHLSTAAWDQMPDLVIPSETTSEA